MLAKLNSRTRHQLRHGGIVEHKFLNIKYIIIIEKDFWNTHADAFIMPSPAASI